MPVMAELLVHPVEFEVKQPAVHLETYMDPETARFLWPEEVAAFVREIERRACEVNRFEDIVDEVQEAMFQGLKQSSDDAHSFQYLAGLFEVFH